MTPGEIALKRGVVQEILATFLQQGVQPFEDGSYKIISSPENDMSCVGNPAMTPQQKEIVRRMLKAKRITHASQVRFVKPDVAEQARITMAQRFLSRP